MHSLNLVILSTVSIGVILVDMNWAAHYVVINFSLKTATSYSATVYSTSGFNPIAGAFSATLGPIIAKTTSELAPSLAQPSGYTFPYPVASI